MISWGAATPTVGSIKLLGLEDEALRQLLDVESIGDPHGVVVALVGEVHNFFLLLVRLQLLQKITGVHLDLEFSF